MPPTRSLRPRRAQQQHVDVDDGGSESDLGGSHGRSDSDEGDSEDEWRPEKDKPRKRVRLAVDDDDNDASESDGGLPGKKQKQREPRAKPRQQTSSTSTSASPPQRPAYDDAIEDEAERERLEREARDAWEQVRQKKSSGGSDDAAKKTGGAKKDGKDTNAGDAAKKTAATSSSSGTDGRGGLAAWLGLPPIPWPTSPESSRIFDRDSLFIGFAYPLESSSASSLTPILNHLTSVVHPSLPASIFPTAFSHLDPKRRGSSHDMHALRVLELKRGRNGLGGPNDFGLEERSDDDGERWGGDKILKVMKEMGAVDLLVIVSRWYGGTNLGPVRFEHIVNCARETVRAHMAQEALRPLREQLRALDAEIATAKAGLGIAIASTAVAASADYADLHDVEKAMRLVNARRKQLDMFQKRKAAAAANAPQPSQSQEPTRPLLEAKSPQLATQSQSQPPRDDSPSTAAAAVETTTIAQDDDDGANAGTKRLDDVDASAAASTDVLAGWDDLA